MCAARTEMVQARVLPDLKSSAEGILSSLGTMTDDELAAELQDGLDYAKAGNFRPVSEARADFRRKLPFGYAIQGGLLQ